MNKLAKIDLRGLSQTERTVIDSMTRIGKNIFRVENLESHLGYKRSHANLVLSRLSKKGWLQRLGRGIYRIIPLGSDSTNPMPDDPWAIATELFSPCYLSGWTAAEHWDLTEQIFNSTVVYTENKQRTKNHKIAGLNFRTKFISKNTFFGTSKIWSNNASIQIADMHKTIIDILDDPSMGGGGLHSIGIFKAYIQKKEASLETLWKYAEQLDQGAVFKRLGFLVERTMPSQLQWSNKLLSKINTGIINFDPSGPKKGPIITKWGIKINVPLEDIL